MTTMIVDHRVEDYDAWRPHFDRSWTQDWTKGVRSYQVWRDEDDPNHIFVANTFDSREAAEAMAGNPLLLEAMGEGGVIPDSVQIAYVEEVGSGTP
jgi:quinol monooxygenase YgiN